MLNQLIKKCTICELLKGDSAFEKHINYRLKLKVPLKEILSEFSIKKNIKRPSEYYLKKHMDICLVDLIVPTDFIERDDTVCNSNEKEKEIEIDFDAFDKMSDIQKDHEYRKHLHRI